MRGFAQFRSPNWIRAIVTVIVTMFFMNVASADDAPSNQIRGVKISRTGAQTLITVAGSERPSYTAFKLKSPSRLVIDIADSQVRGVPSVIESDKELVDGVAVCEYSVKGVPVARVMINFSQDAAYRVRIKGNNLIASLSGPPQTKVSKLNRIENQKNAEINSAQKKLQDARKQIEKARAEAKAIRNETELEILKARQEIENHINNLVKCMIQK